MNKVNAFIFICFYLFMNKIVFASEIEIEGKAYQCKKTAYQKHLCTFGSRQAYVVKSESSEYVAITKESNGYLKIRGVNKVTDEGKLNYSKTDGTQFYEDSYYNRIVAADIVLAALPNAPDEAFAKEIKSDAQKIIAAGRDPKKEIKLYLDDVGYSYKCTQGATRPYTKAETAYQEKTGARFLCPFYACTGENPDNKVLMMLPKPGSTFTQPTAMLLQYGAGRLFEGGFKVTDNSSVPVAVVPKKITPPVDPELPEEDLPSDLLIPSVFGKNTDTYTYLMGVAKKNTDVTELADLCSYDRNLAPFFDEQKRVAELVQKMTAEAEIVEYLKVIDNRIHSFYVDRTKGEKLGCYYQNKIVDPSVMEKFDRLKEISSVQSTGKFLKPDEAQDLFKKARNMKDIPFGYKYDGCYARAHVMARRFEKMGIPVKKAWIKGNLSIEGTDISWEYHVAPVVEVKEKNGKIVNYVIDPSVNDRAVPLDEWVASIKSKAKGPVMKTTYPFPANGLDFDRTSVAVSNSSVYGPVDTEDMTEENKMELSLARLKKFSNALAEAR